MAEPGLLVRRRPDGREDCFQAQWGGSEPVLSAVLEAGRPPRRVADWDPFCRAVRRAEWLADLDYLRLSTVYIQAGDRTSVYLPLWFGLPAAGLSADPEAGALVRVRSLADARRVREDWRTLKGELGDAIAGERLPLATVPVVLHEALINRETLDGLPPPE
ncbi:MAG: hypothetical protein V5A30_10365 [Haloarculaceae archaeon]